MQVASERTFSILKIMAVESPPVWDTSFVMIRDLMYPCPSQVHHLTCKSLRSCPPCVHFKGLALLLPPLHHLLVTETSLICWVCLVSLQCYMNSLLICDDKKRDVSMSLLGWPPYIWELKELFFLCPLLRTCFVSSIIPWATSGFLRGFMWWEECNMCMFKGLCEDTYYVW